MAWTERYNCHQLQIGAFTINVNWSMTMGRKWVVEFNGIRLKNDVKDLEAAKDAALALAKKHLSAALVAVDEEAARRRGE